MDNIKGVIGDSMFFSLLENDVKEELQERPGFGIESIHRIEKNIPSPSPLGPPMLPMSSRLVIIKEPGADALKRIHSACGKYDDLHVILEWEDDSYDKRSKLIKELVEDNSIKLVGYIHPHEKHRFSKVAEMFCRSENLDLSEEAVSTLFSFAPKMKRNTTMEKDGKKQRREKFVINLQRAKNEAIKAQCLAGIGNKVEPNHIKDIVSHSQESDAWSLIDSITSGDLEMSIKHLDGCVVDMGSANEIIGLIRSQLLLMMRVKGIMDSISDPDIVLQDVMSRLVPSNTKYEAWGEETEQKQSVIPNWYRVQRLMNLRGDGIWDNCESAVEMCLNTYKDMHGWLSSDWKSSMTVLCMRLCSLS